MPTIMVSYRFNHSEKAQKIKDQAEKLGFKVWLFEDCKPIGKTVVGNYSQAISKADFVFVLLSEDYWESGHTKQELKHAIQRGVEVFKSLEKFVFLITTDDKTDYTKYMTDDFSALRPLHRYRFNEVDELLKDLATTLSQPSPSSSSTWQNEHCFKFATTTDLKRITPQDTVSHALFVMEGAKIRHLIVEDNNNVFQGIVSRRDVEKLIANSSNAQIPVQGNAMTPYNPDTSQFRYAREDTSLQQVVQWFAEPIVLGNRRKYISAIPILANNRRCVGIISYIDIIKLLKKRDIPVPSLQASVIMRTLRMGIFVAPVKVDGNPITLSDIYQVHMVQRGGVRTIPVIENANDYEIKDDGTRYIVSGMITDHTIYMQLGNEKAGGWPVTDERIMTPINRLDTVSETTTIADIIDRDFFLRAPRPDALLVVSRNHEKKKILRGILSYVDIFRALLG